MDLPCLTEFARHQQITIARRNFLSPILYGMPLTCGFPLNMAYQAVNRPRGFRPRAGLDKFACTSRHLCTSASAPSAQVRRSACTERCMKRCSAVDDGAGTDAPAQQRVIPGSASGGSGSGEGSATPTPTACPAPVSRLHTRRFPITQSLITTATHPCHFRAQNTLARARCDYHRCGMSLLAPSPDGQCYLHHTTPP